MSVQLASYTIFYHTIIIIIKTLHKFEKCVDVKKSYVENYIDAILVSNIIKISYRKVSFIADHLFILNFFL